MPSQKEIQKFAIYAEAKEYWRPLIMTHLPFARLIDDIVFPFEKNEPFLIDGAPLQRDRITKIKILRLLSDFPESWDRFHQALFGGGSEQKRIYGEQYHLRVEAILRRHCEDVTAQLLKTFHRVIRPRWDEYEHIRDDLIHTAAIDFVQSLKRLGSAIP
ncbi:MAG: hypothetical protein ACE15F_19420 [bacterium]